MSRFIQEIDLDDFDSELATFSNDCHDPETGEFCETGDSTERYFGDYKMEYINPEMGNGLHRIVTTYGDTQVAEMQWSAKQIEGLDVNDEHQRKGIARAMWEWGQEMRPRPKHSADRTTKGDAWAKAIGGKLPRRLKQPPPFEYSAGVETFANPCHEPNSGRFCKVHGPTFPGQDVQRPLPGTVYKDYNKESEEWIAKLTPEEKKAAADYTGSYLYEYFNKEAIAGENTKRVAALDSALEKAGKRDTPIRVYRRVGFPTPKGEEPGAGRDRFMETVKVGEEIDIARPGSFISTSVTPRYPVTTGWPTGSVLFEIHTRSGAAIGNVTEGGGTQREKELLLPRNTRFRVVAIQHDVQFGPPPKTRGLGDTNKRLVIQVEEVE